VYLWIWRHLPGSIGDRVVLAVLLALTVAALLLFVVFPALDGHLQLWDPAV
jgi:hypothetical protein